MPSKRATSQQQLPAEGIFGELLRKLEQGGWLQEKMKALLTKASMDKAEKEEGKRILEFFNEDSLRPPETKEGMQLSWPGKNQEKKKERRNRP